MFCFRLISFILPCTWNLTHGWSVPETEPLRIISVLSASSFSSGPQSCKIKTGTLAGRRNWRSSCGFQIKEDKSLDQSPETIRCRWCEIAAYFPSHRWFHPPRNAASLICTLAGWQVSICGEGKKTREDDRGSSRYYLTCAKSIQADWETERQTFSVSFFFPPCTYIKREKRQLNQSDS